MCIPTPSLPSLLRMKTGGRGLVPARTAGDSADPEEEGPQETKITVGWGQKKRILQKLVKYLRNTW